MKETYEEKVITYVLGILDDAKARGTIRGGTFRLSKEGLQEYEQLKKEKFHPSQKDIEAAFVLLSQPPDEILAAYKEHGKIQFEWSTIHLWIWMYIKRFFIFMIKPFFELKRRVL